MTDHPEHLKAGKMLEDAPRKGRPVINRELKDAQERLARVNAGLLACYETIAIGQQKKATLEQRIASLIKGK